MAAESCIEAVGKRHLETHRAAMAPAVPNIRLACHVAVSPVGILPGRRNVVLKLRPDNPLRIRGSAPSSAHLSLDVDSWTLARAARRLRRRPWPAGPLEQAEQLL